MRHHVVIRSRLVIAKQTQALLRSDRPFVAGPAMARMASIGFPRRRGHQLQYRRRLSLLVAGICCSSSLTVLMPGSTSGISIDDTHPHAPVPCTPRQILATISLLTMTTNPPLSKQPTRGTPPKPCGLWPLQPTYAAVFELEAIRIYVRDHRQRELTIADRTCEAPMAVSSSASRGGRRTRRAAWRSRSRTAAIRSLPGSSSTRRGAMARSRASPRRHRRPQSGRGDVA